MRRKNKITGTGTYAIRNGEVVKISEKPNGFEQPSALPDFSKGPISMWTEYRKQDNFPVKAPRYDANGFPAFQSMNEIRDYQSRCADVGKKTEWTR